MKLSFAALTACLAVAACSVVQTTQPGAIGVDRRQYMLVSEQEIESGAAQAYQQELDKARQQGALNRNPEHVKRVRAIADRLIPQTTVFRPDAMKWDWQVNVQDTPDLNAYCMPGGKIMVYSGIIEQLKLNDDELATIIGHEMAHALREHTRERVSRAYAEQLGLAALAVATGAGSTTMQLASQVSQVTFTLPHSREQEAESDRVGLELMARAGYNPNSSVTLWQKMARAGGSSGPGFLSTHPTSEARIRDLQASIPRVLPFYEATRR